jgi:hypothetical protein
MSSCKGNYGDYKNSIQKAHTHNTTKIKASIYNLKRNKYLKKYVKEL